MNYPQRTIHFISRPAFLVFWLHKPEILIGWWQVGYIVCLFWKRQCSLTVYKRVYKIIWLIRHSDLWVISGGRTLTLAFHQSTQPVENQPFLFWIQLYLPWAPTMSAMTIRLKHQIGLNRAVPFTLRTLQNNGCARGPSALTDHVWRYET